MSSAVFATLLTLTPPGVVETWLAMPPRNVTCMATLNEWLNENEYKVPAKPEKAEAEAEAEAEAPQSDEDKRATAIER
jgi:hypothetical protein